MMLDLLRLRRRLGSRRRRGAVIVLPTDTRRA